MPKRMKSQRRGKGKPRFTSPTHKYKVAVSYPFIEDKMQGEIVDIINDPVRTAPVSIIQLNKGLAAIPSAEGIKVGDLVYFDAETPRKGDVMRLKNIPEGTVIFNLEVIPGDGGKMVRGAGLSARVVSKDEKIVIVKLPSRKQKKFHPNCMASIGIAAGGGRKDKPLLKAGKKYHSIKNKTKSWPVVAGGAMNAGNHPFGGGMRRHKKRKTIARRMPPGRKVGSIAAKRTGRKRGSR